MCLAAPLCLHRSIGRASTQTRRFHSLSAYDCSVCPLEFTQALPSRLEASRGCCHKCWVDRWSLISAGGIRTWQWCTLWLIVNVATFLCSLDLRSNRGREACSLFVDSRLKSVLDWCIDFTRAWMTVTPLTWWNLCERDLAFIIC